MDYKYLKSNINIQRIYLGLETIKEALEYKYKLQSEKGDKTWLLVVKHVNNMCAFVDMFNYIQF